MENPAIFDLTFFENYGAHTWLRDHVYVENVLKNANDYIVYDGRLARKVRTDKAVFVQVLDGMWNSKH